jgi:hypothetical protein
MKHLAILFALLTRLAADTASAFGGTLVTLVPKLWLRNAGLEALASRHSRS